MLDTKWENVWLKNEYLTLLVIFIIAFLLRAFPYINEVMGKNVEIKSSPSKVREENMDEYADISKIKGIGWEPEISLRDGIRRIVE